MRAYTYIDDMLDGILLLMRSDLENGVNIGRREYVSVDELIADHRRDRRQEESTSSTSQGPVGVKARNFSNDRILRSAGRPEFP